MSIFLIIRNAFLTHHLTHFWFGMVNDSAGIQARAASWKKTRWLMHRLIFSRLEKNCWSIHRLISFGWKKYRQSMHRLISFSWKKPSIGNYTDWCLWSTLQQSCHLLTINLFAQVYIHWTQTYASQKRKTRWSLCNLSKSVLKYLYVVRTSTNRHNRYLLPHPAKPFQCWQMSCYCCIFRCTRVCFRWIKFD